METRDGKRIRSEAAGEFGTRRRFAFRLRTVFLLVTVACAALSWTLWNLNWIRERREYFAEMDPPAMAALNEGRLLVDAKWLAGGDPDVRAPASLWLFGEKGYPRLNMLLPKSEFVRPTPNPLTDYISETDPHFQRARRLFPEAKLFFFPYAEPEPNRLTDLPDSL